MRLAILSDFHVAPGLESNFSLDDESIAVLVKSLRSSAEKIIFAGDIFELDQSINPFCSKFKIIRNIIRKYPKLWTVLNHRNSYLVYGNHDIELEEMSACEYIDVKGKKGNVRILHGHQLDNWINSKLPIDKMICWFVGMLERFGWKKAEVVLTKFHLRLLKSPKWSNSIHSYRRKAMKYMSENNISCLIMGHTHFLDAYQNEDRLFINTGCVANSKVNYCIIDTDTLEYELHEYKASELKKKKNNSNIQSYRNKKTV